jgi:phosphate transport system substrate-binding protein
MRISLVFLWALSCTFSFVAEGANVRTAGSATMHKPFVVVSEAYSKKHGDVKVENILNTSTQGIQDLIDGKVEIARSSRELRPDEQEKAFQKSLKLKTFHVAYDALAVVIHPTKAKVVRELTMEQIKKIFVTGELKDWSQVSPKLKGAIQVYIRDPKESGAGEFFVEKVSGSKTASYVANAHKLAATPDAVPAVANDSNAISYVPLSFLDKTVSQVPVKEGKGAAVKCNEQTVRNHTYPIARKLYVIADPTASPAVAKFIDFVLTPEGQGELQKAELIRIR